MKRILSSLFIIAILITSFPFPSNAAVVDSVFGAPFNGTFTYGTAMKITTPTNYTDPNGVTYSYVNLYGGDTVESVVFSPYKTSSNQVVIIPLLIKENDKLVTTFISAPYSNGKPELSYSLTEKSWLEKFILNDGLDSSSRSNLTSAMLQGIGLRYMDCNRDGVTETDIKFVDIHPAFVSNYSSTNSYRVFNDYVFLFSWVAHGYAAQEGSEISAFNYDVNILDNYAYRSIYNMLTEDRINELPVLFRSAIYKSFYSESAPALETPGETSTDEDWKNAITAIISSDQPMIDCPEARDRLAEDITNEDLNDLTEVIENPDSSPEDVALAQTLYMILDESHSKYTTEVTAYINSISTDISALYRLYSLFDLDGVSVTPESIGLPPRPTEQPSTENNGNLPYTWDDVKAEISKLSTTMPDELSGLVAQSYTLAYALNYYAFYDTVGSTVDPAIQMYLDADYIDAITTPNTDFFRATSKGINNPSAYAGLLRIGQVLTRFRDNFLSTYYIQVKLKDEQSSIQLNTIQLQMLQSAQKTTELLGWESWFNEEVTFTYNGAEYATSLAEMYKLIDEAKLFEGLTSYNPADSSTAFRWFFEDSKLSTPVLQGIALSATYIPMHTNVYDPYVVSNYMRGDEDFMNFHYTYGYYRKALMIDTNVDSATDYVRTGRRGTLQVATLSDLLQTDREICLYINHNFYNIDQLAEAQDQEYNRFTQSSESADTGNWFENLWSGITEFFTIDITELAKTGAGKELYTSRKTFDQFDIASENSNVSTDGLMSSTAIYNYLGLESAEDGADDYNIMKQFAVISAVYRDNEVKNGENLYISNERPVFMSSSNVATLQEAAARPYSTSLFNYLILCNLESQMPIGASTNLDMNSPLYMDIYGNILTESGTVVIPAAVNASLYDSDQFIPMGAGFFSLYGEEYKLPSTWSNVENVMSRIAVRNGETWDLRALQTVDGAYNTSALSIADKSTLQALQDSVSYNLMATDYINFEMWRHNIIEVLRGAPIEFINKDLEDLNTVRTLDSWGLLTAAKLEELDKQISFSGMNATIALPNPAFFPNEWVSAAIFAIYKIGILLLIIVWLFQIYLDTVSKRLGWKTIVRCLSTLTLALSVVIIIPATFDVTYYQSNKLFLQNEVEQLNILNIEKKDSGREIGVTEVTGYDDKTDKTVLYLRLSDLQVDWIKLLPTILTSSAVDSLSSVYDQYKVSSPLYNDPGIETLNDGIFISSDVLFASTDLQLATNSDGKMAMLKQVTNNTELPASYFSPYYVFLDAVLDRVNNYNLTNNIYAYTTKVQSGGRVKTVGLCDAFFNSYEFADGSIDTLALYELYKQTPQYYQSTVFDSATIDSLLNSLWYRSDLSDEQIVARIDKMQLESRRWVGENIGLIGRVSDETFIKAYCLHMAMYHNQIFGVGCADSLEVFNLSNSDITRLSIASKEQVMEGSPLSFSRFVYDIGGTVAVLVACVLVIVLFVASWIKPIAVLLIFGAVFGSIFIYRILLHKKTNNIFGYIAIVFQLSLTNILYSVLLKLSIYLPSFGLTPTVCMLVQIIMQLAYMYLLCKVAIRSLKSYRDLGFEKLTSEFLDITQARIRGFFQQVPSSQKKESGMDYYNELSERQQKRALKR